MSQPTISPSGIYLYNRSYSITVGTQLNSSTAKQYANFSRTIDGTVVPASPIKVTFDIEKTNIGSPNKAKFEIYNVSSQTRNSIAQGVAVQFQAGYKGLVQTVFVGNVHPKGVKSERKGADIVTSFECGDGESAITTSVLNKAYAPGTTLAQILTDIGTAMSVTTSESPDGVTAGVSLGIPNVVYGKGISIHGACKDSLNKLLTPLNLSWSVQNFALTIIPKGSYNGASAIVVSKYTGLINTPSMDQFLHFDSLLNPSLVPNAIVKLESDNTALNGFYKINKAHYVGDTHDNKWQVSCECVKMLNVTQNLPAAVGFNYAAGVEVG